MTKINRGKTILRGDATDNSGYQIANIRTRVINVGLAGDGTEVEIALAANTTAQNFDLGAIIPARSVILNAQLETNEAFSGGVVSAKLGSTSGGTDIIALTTHTSLNTITGIAVAGAPVVVPAIAASNVFLGLTRSGANWSALTAGSMKVRITYLDYSSNY